MSSPATTFSFDTLEDHIERQIALTDWIRIEQADATAFGHLTHDPDPMHIDPAWAQVESPFGGTVLAGLHLLSLLPRLSRGSGLDIAGVQLAMNYGFDRVRFVAPVPVGADLRNRIHLLRVQRRPDGKAIIVTRNEFEVRDVEGPALVAEWVNMLWPDVRSDHQPGG